MGEGQRGGRVFVLEEVTHVNVSLRFEQLLQAAVVIQVLVGENHRVDGAAVQSKRIEIATKCRFLWAPVDEDFAVAISNVDGVALANVENAYDQLRATGVRCERGYGRRLPFRALRSSRRSS